MNSLIGKLLPEQLKSAIRNTSLYRNHKGRKYPAWLAKTSKRLDICAAQFAHVLHLSGARSLSGRTCLEVGSGYVLSHAIICHLLGARRVIATDVYPHADPSVLGDAINESIASIVRDLLSPFESHEVLRERLNRLLSTSHFDFKTLEDLGIEYIAPLDFAVDKLAEKADFIYSNSVLEHVPAEDIVPVMNNLAGMLGHEGEMIHCIHLEDHEDIANNPFGFLAVPAEVYGRAEQTSRGNRIRFSEWNRIFGSLDSCKYKYIYRHSRLDRPLPGRIDASIACEDEADLRVSHIGVHISSRAE